MRLQEEPSRGGDDASDDDGEPKAAAVKAGKVPPAKAKGKAKKKGKDDWSDDDDTPKKPQAAGGESEVRSHAPAVFTQARSSLRLVVARR